jgi:hypothetical protein
MVGALMTRPVFLSYAWVEPDGSEASHLDDALGQRGFPSGVTGVRCASALTTRRRCGGQSPGTAAALCSTPPLGRSRLSSSRRSSCPRWMRGAAPAGVCSSPERSSEATASPTATASRRYSTRRVFRSAAPTHAASTPRTCGRASNERRWPSLRQYLEALRPCDAVTVHAEMYADIAWRDAAQLQLNWHSVEQSRDPNMGDLLLPALADLREGLAAQGRPGQIDLTGRLRLPAALALGYAFHQATGWRLSITHDDQTWVAARSDGSLDSLTVSEHPHAPTVSGDLVVVVSIAQDVLSAVRAHRKASGRTVRMPCQRGLPNRPDRRPLPRVRQAL